MRLQRILSIVLLCFFSGDIIQTVHADFLTFTDAGSWTIAAGPLSFEENFDGFDSDIDFSFGTTDAPNGFSVSHSGATDFRNLIDVSPYDFEADSIGSNSIAAFVNLDDNDLVTIGPDENLSAFSFESSFASESEGVNALFFDQNDVLITNIVLSNITSDFVGVTTSNGTFISRIDFVADTLVVGTAGEGFRLDNISGVEANAIPEPSSFAIMAAMSLAVIWRRRQ